jgi:hypothetical protein
MKRFLILAAVATGLVLPAGALSGFDTVEAAPPKTQPQSCRADDSRWFGMFQGFGQRGLYQDVMMYEAGCFRTQASCKAWLYWLRSDHGAGEKLASCKKRT